MLSEPGVPTRSGTDLRRSARIPGHGEDDMRIARLLGSAGACGVAVFLLAGAAPVDTGQAFTHTVAAGETVSLLCIQYYGFYSEKLATGFLADNPALKDINLIRVGQELVFRRPSVHGVETASDSRAERDFLVAERVKATQGVVTYVEGEVTLTPQATGKKRKLTANVLVYPGDVIETAKGRAELIVNRESVVRLRENSRLDIEAFRDNKEDKGKTRIGFSLGSVWTKVRKFKDRICRFELELPVAIAGVHGTVYQTSVALDTSMEVKVYRGEVAVKKKPLAEPGEIAGPEEVPGPHEVSMEAWTEIVRSMQTIRIDKVESFEKDPDDEWERWNEKRDRRIAEIFREI
jgi:hypothetical protein